MTRPGEIKTKVQTALHQRANRSVSWSGDSRLGHLFRDVKLYSRDSELEFADTHLGRFVQRQWRAQAA